MVRKRKLTGKEYIVKTVVTTELIADMAKHYKVPYWDVLTGFKFIADIIQKNEDKMTFIGGGEESYGFMIGDFVRDKDAVYLLRHVSRDGCLGQKPGQKYVRHTDGNVPEVLPLPGILDQCGQERKIGGRGDPADDGRFQDKSPQKSEWIPVDHHS